MTATLFELHDDAFLPTEYTRGPWRPDAQHGGPPAALLAFLSEPHVDADEFLAHIEIELVRPVPLSELHGRVQREQASGRVHRVRAELRSGDLLVARSNALVLRRSEITGAGWKSEPAPATDPPPVDLAIDPPRWASGGLTAYHRNAVEHRITEGEFGAPGPAVDWVRLRTTVVSDHEPSAWQRTLAAADFGSGISALYGPESRFGLINANLAVSLHRLPDGPWISVDARTDAGPQGTGLCVSALGDRHGPIGVATQSLLGYALG